MATLTPNFPAWYSRIAVRLKILCARFTLASKTLKGPIKIGKPGREALDRSNPRAARFRVLEFCDTAAEMLGINGARDSVRSPRASASLSLANKVERLFFRASSIVSCRFKV